LQIKQYLNLQRMNPLLQKMENAKLVRAQALMASQGQQYAMLGTLATAGKLATGSQAERGATYAYCTWDLIRMQVPTFKHLVFHSGK
jgi:hypothetical protein